MGIEQAKPMWWAWGGLCANRESVVYLGPRRRRASVISTTLAGQRLTSFGHRSAIGSVSRAWF